MRNRLRFRLCATITIIAPNISNKPPSACVARPRIASGGFGRLCGEKQFSGLRFRRQQPVGPYIVDFYCSAAKLIVELDGSQHGSMENRIYDSARDDWLRSQGYRVLRFPNEEFLKHPDTVFETIDRAIAEAGIPR